MDAEKISVDGFNLNISDAKARNMISDKYDPDNGTYVVGDTCINDDILYICNTDIDTPEAFDPTKWDADTVGHYCSELKSNLTDNSTDDSTYQISLDRVGNMRNLTFFRINWGKVKSFIDNLPSTDNPRGTRIYSNTIYKSFNSGGVQKYCGIGFIIIRMNDGTRETTAVTATAYNSGNATETVIADTDQVTGELTWFTD